MIAESMKISDEQLEVFNIFKLINPSILLKPGQRVSTISNNKNIMGVADFNTLNIPVQAPIYDLHVFLNLFLSFHLQINSTVLFLNLLIGAQFFLQ